MTIVNPKRMPARIGAEKPHTYPTATTVILRP